VNLTSKFSLRKKNLHANWWLFTWGNFLISSNPQFFLPSWSTENRTEITTIFVHNRVFKDQGSGGYCNVTSRTWQSVFHAISYSLLVYVCYQYWSQMAEICPHRCVVGGCSNVRISENRIGTSYDTVLRRWAYRSKETKEKMDRFCKTDLTCWMGTYQRAWLYARSISRQMTLFETTRW